MAEEKKTASAETKAAVPAPKKRGGKVGLIVMMTIFGASVPFVYPSLMLLVGMIPTVVALFTGNDRQGSSVTAVGAMNAAGIAPFVVELWQKGQTVENALRILQTPETWLVMFGAAAVGQLILFAVPQAIASGTLVRAETRLKLLKDNLERLKTVWGADVASTKSMEKIAKGE